MSLQTVRLECVCLLALLSVMTSHQIQYSDSALLSANFGIYWGHNSTHIMIRVEADARGWVGFGFASQENSMSPGDVCIGYVDGDRFYLGDYGTQGHQATLDGQQDCHLIRIVEDANGKTTMQFIRKLVTNDINDIPIREGETMNVIYAGSSSDPASNSRLGHHSFRGMKRMVLIPAGALVG